MNRRSSVVALATALSLLFSLAATGPALGASSKSQAKATAKHERIVSYWTAERMANAVPRDFVKAKGGFKPAKRGGGGKPDQPGGGGGGGDISGTSTGAPWNAGGAALEATGKVFFRMGGVDYVCSGAAVDDGGRPGYSLVLTAGHCTYDETNGRFASFWMFIPKYDAKPTTNCRRTPHGCFTAVALVVHDGYASAGGFNAQAIGSDWGLAVVGTGSNGGQLDARVPAFDIEFDTVTQKMYAFGYPAAFPYNGRDLIYCAGAVSGDTRNASRTWGMDCDMTPGSSGGPWMKEFDTVTKSGVLNSLDSYKYNDQPDRMYGPRFKAETEATYDAALTTTSNTIAN